MARILIIDDDEKFLKMFQQMLERAGHEVMTAPNGKVGTKLFRKDPTELINPSSHRTYYWNIDWFIFWRNSCISQDYWRYVH